MLFIANSERILQTFKVLYTTNSLCKVSPSSIQVKIWLKNSGVCIISNNLGICERINTLYESPLLSQLNTIGIILLSTERISKYSARLAKFLSNSICI